MKTVGFAAFVCLVSCAGTLHDRIETVSGPIWVGMSGDRLAETLGPPDSSTIGWLYARHASAFAVSLGPRTVEWAWKRPAWTIVAWLEAGSVVGLGTIPPPAPGEKKSAGPARIPKG